MAGHYGTKQNRTPLCKECAAPKYRAGFCREHYFARLRARRAEKRVVRIRRIRERRALPQPTDCRECGASFIRNKQWQKFCGDACSKADRNRRLRKNRKAAIIEGNCESCGQPFTKPRHLYVKRLIQRQPKFCSLSCAYAARRGADSPKFRGGVITYRGAKWLDVAEQTRARDQYLCVPCGALTKSRKHSVDHIIPFRLMVQWGLDPNQPDNLVTTCGSCHGKKQGFEDRLIRGDVVGFLRGLVSIHYPLDRIRAACALAGLSMNGIAA
jgi:5-methylcytosine-specific restriction endonuclease McrA